MTQKQFNKIYIGQKLLYKGALHVCTAIITRDNESSIEIRHIDNDEVIRFPSLKFLDHVKSSNFKMKKFDIKVPRDNAEVYRIKRSLTHPYDQKLKIHFEFDIDEHGWSSNITIIVTAPGQETRPLTHDLFFEIGVPNNQQTLLNLTFTRLKDFEMFICSIAIVLNTIESKDPRINYSDSISKWAYEQIKNIKLEK